MEGKGEGRRGRWRGGSWSEGRKSKMDHGTFLRSKMINEQGFTSYFEMYQRRKVTKGRRNDGRIRVKLETTND